MVNGQKMVEEKEKALKSGKMAQSIQDIGKKIKQMERVV